MIEIMLWGKVIGLVRPMRLIDKSLRKIKRGAIECASHNIFSSILLCASKNHEL